MAPEPTLTRTACLQCRQIKVRCDKSDKHQRCIRCERLNFQCEFKPHARGRKRSDQSSRLRSPRHDPFRACLDTRVSSPDPNRFEDTLKAPRPTSKPLSLEAVLNPNTLTPSGTPQPTDASPVPSENHTAKPVSVASSYHENVLTQGVAIEAECERLFKFFFRELNTMIALLDPQLHTIEYTSNHYPLVFSSVIAVASRFSRPDIFPACAEISRRVMALAAVEDLCNLDYVQSLSIHCFWKESGDNTAWRKIGRAIRMAFELELHTSHKEPTNSNYEQTNRENMNRQRTWMQLCCFDTAFYSPVIQCFLPEMIPFEYRINPYQWHLSRRDWTLPGDARLVCSLELDGIRRDTQLLNDILATTNTTAPINTLIRTVQSRIKTCQGRWMSDHPILPLDECTSSQLSFLLQLYSLRINQVILKYQKATHVPELDQKMLFMQCVFDATTILRMLVDRIAIKGYLRASQDWTFLGAAYAGKWLYDHRTRIDDLTIRECIGIFHESVSACSADSRTPDEPSAYLARFFQAMLPSLRGDARHSRSTSTTVSEPATVALVGHDHQPPSINTILERNDLPQAAYVPIKPANGIYPEGAQNGQDQNGTPPFLDLFGQDAEYWDAMFSNWHAI